MPQGGWKEYFAFSKKERVAVFILLAIMAVFICLSFFYTPVFTSPVIDKDVQSQLTALSSGGKEKLPKSGVNAEDSSSPRGETVAAANRQNTIKKEQFYFDPNTLSAEGWARLGFKDKTIQNILNYRANIGKFKKPDDLYKVPRIRKKSVEAILPLVRIGLPPSANDGLPPVKITSTPVAVTGAKTAYKTINVNTATAEDFKAFPGVTDAVANRIIKFRNSINGFTTVDDVAKTYGLTNEAFQTMRPYLAITPK